MSLLFNFSDVPVLDLLIGS